jgi:hypothetical protein
MPRGGPRPCPNNGGKRPGAGRKPGSATKRTQKTTVLAEQLAGEGPLPLQVMLEAMRYYREQGQLDKAAAIARDAAPYEHPRKSTVTVQGGEQPVEVRVIRDDNFYHNADRLPAERNEASTLDSSA